MHFSTDNESKALLTGNEEESVDCAKRDSECCSTLNGEAVGRENAAEEAKPEMKEGVENHYETEPVVHVTQSGCHDNVQREEEFTAKDLLSFAWQIARGMVG